MSLITKKGFGFKFDPEKCEECGGKCCIGEPGNVFVNQLEMRAIAEFLKINFIDFKTDFLVRYDNKYSIKEIVRGESHDCLFFDIETKKCTIYPVRPMQCRTFPFWDYYKNHPDEFDTDCPGVIFD